jgi:hypothetical protein
MLKIGMRVPYMRFADRALGRRVDLDFGILKERD